MGTGPVTGETEERFDQIASRLEHRMTLRRESLMVTSIGAVSALGKLL
jgi:hypothetical protein